VLVVGLDLPDQRGLDLIATIARDEACAELPIIVFTPAAVSASDQATLTRLGQSMVLKHVRSQERLFDEASLFLHRRVSTLPAAKQQVLEELHQASTMLAGKKVLVVDDDIRNIFAMTSMLDAHDMVTLSADTGKIAIEVLEQTPDVDIVLMDIMMPEMDGYDTMRAIRRKSSCQGLPIIAVTAKAMKGDRDKCFEAGASDYLSKPVDPEQLVALLRVWLRR